MTFTNDLADGIARMISTAGVGTYFANGAPYITNGQLAPGVSASIPVVTIGTLIPKPDLVIAVTPYLSTPSLWGNDVTVRVQFAVRGTTDSRTVNTIQDNLFDLFNNAVSLTLNGIRVVSVSQATSTFAPQIDQSERWFGTSNYAFEATRPTANSTD